METATAMPIDEPVIIPRPDRWTAEIVSEWIREAVETERVLPSPKPTAYRSMMPEATAKTDFRDEDKEIAVLRGGFQSPGIDAGAIDRYDQVQTWLAWLLRTDRQIVISWAYGLSNRATTRRLRRHGTRMHHETVKRHREAAFRRIARRLNYGEK